MWWLDFFRLNVCNSWYITIRDAEIGKSERWHKIERTQTTSLTKSEREKARGCKLIHGAESALLTAPVLQLMRVITHYCDNLSCWFLALSVSLISGQKRHLLMFIVLCPMTVGTWSPTKSAVLPTEQESDKSVAIVYPRCDQSVTYAPWSVNCIPTFSLKKSSYHIGQNLER